MWCIVVFSYVDEVDFVIGPFGSLEEAKLYAEDEPGFYKSQGYLFCRMRMDSKVVNP